MEIAECIRLQAAKIIGPYLSRFGNSKERYSQVVNRKDLKIDTTTTKSLNKRALILNLASGGALQDSLYANSLILQGYRIKVLSPFDPFVKKIFEKFGIQDVEFYNDYFWKLNVTECKLWVDNELRNVKSEDDFLKIKFNGISVGKFAASSYMRRTRSSNVSILGIQKKDSLLRNTLMYSLKSAKIAKEVIDKYLPDLILVNDRGYSPVGEFFDYGLKKGIHIIQRIGSHKSGFEVLKGYLTPDSVHIHPHSISFKNWEDTIQENWNESKWEKLHNEIKSTYESGDWYSEVGTQFNTKAYQREEIFKHLNLDSQKKTVIVFPHIFWDSTFFWGEDLFHDYYDWFVNVLKVAQKKTNVNWILKIHPANIVKAKRDGYTGPHAEEQAVYDTLLKIPDHIKLIKPNTNISTFALYNIMDYCLTVRGTVGIESAMLGKAVLTAGTGRFDRLGFTNDFDSIETYIATLNNIENLPLPTEEQIIKARKFAYATFFQRCIDIDAAEYKFQKSEKAKLIFTHKYNRIEDLEKYKFHINFSKFVSSKMEDFFNN